MRVMKFRRRMSCLEACNLPDHFDWGRNLPTYVGSGLSPIRVLRRLIIARFYQPTQLQQNRHIAAEGECAVCPELAIADISPQEAVSRFDPDCVKTRNKITRA